MQNASVGYVARWRRNRDFRQLWLGQVVSQLGDWFDTIAVYTLVLKLTGSGRAIGLVLVEDNFRGRVFAAELALLTLALAASNYATGELLDRCQVSPRTVTVMIGALFLVPGLLWFATARWWNREREPARAMTKLDTEAAALHDVAKQIHLSAD